MKARKYILTLPFIILAGCGTSNEVDLGASVLVNPYIDSAQPSPIQQDIIMTTDGNCRPYTRNNTYVPAPEQLLLKVEVKPLSENIGQPSPVRIESVEISYKPLNSNTPAIAKYTVYKGDVISPNENKTVNISVANTGQIAAFYNSFLAGNSINYEYLATAKIKMKEVYYDNTLETEINFNIVFQNVMQDGECNTNTNTNP